MSAWRHYLRPDPPDIGPAIQLTFADGHTELVDEATSYRVDDDEFIVELDGDAVLRVPRSEIVIVRTINAVSA